MKPRALTDLMPRDDVRDRVALAQIDQDIRGLEAELARIQSELQQLYRLRNRLMHGSQGGR